MTTPTAEPPNRPRKLLFDPSPPAMPPAQVVLYVRHLIDRIKENLPPSNPKPPTTD